MRRISINLEINANGANSNTIITDYCDSVIFENGIPKTLLTDGGFVSLSDNKYHYFLKDHQNNNRIVADESGNIKEVNHYYPFGGTFANSLSFQPYKYNGKELYRSDGLDWYDYGARMYDAAIGRWHVVDPMAEKYYSSNPYNYCDNEPVGRIDPDGNGWNEAWPFLKSSIETSFSVGLRVEASTKFRNIGAKVGVNMGSLEYGNQGQRITSGISATVGIFGIEMYEKAYDVNPSVAIKEEGYSVGLLVWDEDHKTTTIYDSRGKYYEEINKKETVETSFNADLEMSIHALLGVNIEIDLTKIGDFITNLFK